jgi:hypothetical protein
LIQQAKGLADRKNYKVINAKIKNATLRHKNIEKPAYLGSQSKF